VRLEKAGKHTPIIDGQVAAVAATNGIPVVTANSNDFAIFKDSGRSRLDEHRAVDGSHCADRHQRYHCVVRMDHEEA
jgi:hypothetical protein